MRDYSIVSPNFWTGETGRKIVTAGPECITIALYLLTSQHANMLGIYYLPLAYIEEDTGVDREGVLKALRRCSEGGFCGYDEASKWVFVKKMAAWQVGKQLKPEDNRVKSIQKQYDQMSNNLFLGEFFDLYKNAYHMKNRRGLKGAYEAPSKPGTGTGTGTGTGINNTSVVEGVLLPTTLSDSVEIPDPPPKTKFPYCPDWRPHSGTVDGIKLTAPKITDEFIREQLAEFLLYAANNYRVDQYENKFLKNVVSNWKKKNECKSKNPNGGTGRRETVSDRAQRIAGEQRARILAG